MAEEWQPIETAPKDGRRFYGRRSYVEQYTGKLRYLRRLTRWGKTAHVPLYGWCYGRGEDTSLWEPTHWRPIYAGLPDPPEQS